MTNTPISNNNAAFQSHLSQDFFDPRLYNSIQDTALTAWLMTCGFTFESVSIKDFNYTFIFKKSENLDKAIAVWQSGSPIGNCFFYDNNRRTLMKIVKKNR